MQNPEYFGKTAETTPWSFFDGYPSWDYPGMEGKEAEVQVYSDADEVELLLNGRSLGRKPAGEGAGYIAVFQVAYEP